MRSLRPDRTNSSAEFVAYDLDRHADLGELKVGGRLFLQRDVALFQRRELIDNGGIGLDVDGCQLRAEGVEGARGLGKGHADGGFQGRAFYDQALVVQAHDVTAIEVGHHVANRSLDLSYAPGRHGTGSAPDVLSRHLDVPAGRPGLPPGHLGDVVEGRFHSGPRTHIHTGLGDLFGHDALDRIADVAAAALEVLERLLVVHPLPLQRAAHAYARFRDPVPRRQLPEVSPCVALDLEDSCSRASAVGIAARLLHTHLGLQAKLQEPFERLLNLHSVEEGGQIPLELAALGGGLPGPGAAVPFGLVQLPLSTRESFAVNSLRTEEVGGNLNKEALQDVSQVTVRLVLTKSLPTRLLVKMSVVDGVDFDEAEHLPVREIVVRSRLRPAQLNLQPIVVRVAVWLNAYAVPVDVQTPDSSCLAKQAGVFGGRKGRMPGSALGCGESDVEWSASRPAAPSRRSS